MNASHNRSTQDTFKCLLPTIPCFVLHFCTHWFSLQSIHFLVHARGLVLCSHHEGKHTKAGLKGDVRHRCESTVNYGPPDIDHCLIVVGGKTFVKHSIYVLLLATPSWLNEHLSTYRKCVNMAFNKHCERSGYLTQ